MISLKSESSTTPESESSLLVDRLDRRPEYSLVTAVVLEMLPFITSIINSNSKFVLIY